MKVIQQRKAAAFVLKNLHVAGQRARLGRRRHARRDGAPERDAEDRALVLRDVYDLRGAGRAVGGRGRGAVGAGEGAAVDGCGEGCGAAGGLSGSLGDGGGEGEGGGCYGGEGGEGGDEDWLGLVSR